MATDIRQAHCLEMDPRDSWKTRKPNRSLTYNNYLAYRVLLHNQPLKLRIVISEFCFREFTGPLDFAEAGATSDHRHSYGLDVSCCLGAAKALGYKCLSQRSLAGQGQGFQILT